MLCGRPIEESEWPGLCEGFDRDLDVGLNARDFVMLYPSRTAQDKQLKGLKVPALLAQLEEDYRALGIPYVIPQVADQAASPTSARGGASGGAGRASSRGGGTRYANTEPLENTFPDPEHEVQAHRAKGEMNATAL